MTTYTFTKEDNNWYIDLPEYIEQGGAKADLQMVDGADTMLDRMAEGSNTVTVQIAESPFEGADLLTLTEVCDPIIGGGNYLLKHYEGKEINQTMWLCQVTEFVFGYLPGEIYVRRVESDCLKRQNVFCCHSINWIAASSLPTC